MEKLLCCYCGLLMLRHKLADVGNLLSILLTEVFLLVTAHIYTNEFCVFVCVCECVCNPGSNYDIHLKIINQTYELNMKIFSRRQVLEETHSLLFIHTNPNSVVHTDDTLRSNAHIRPVCTHTSADPHTHTQSNLTLAGFLLNCLC